jgi:hypothetical protein
VDSDNDDGSQFIKVRIDLASMSQVIRLVQALWTMVHVWRKTGKETQADELQRAIEEWEKSK